MEQTYLVAYGGYNRDKKWSMDKEMIKVPSGMSIMDREERMKDILGKKRGLKNLTILTTLQLDD